MLYSELALIGVCSIVPKIEEIFFLLAVKRNIVPRENKKWKTE